MMICPRMIRGPAMAKLIEDSSLRIQNLSAIEVERIEPVDLLGLVRTIWFGKFTVAAAMIATVFLAGYYAFAVATPQFAATATLKIDTRHEPLLSPDIGLASALPDRSSMNTEAAILQSRHLRRQVIAELGLLDDPAFNRYLNDIAPLSPTGLRNSLRAWLTGQKPSPPEAAAILEKTIDNLGHALQVTALRDTYIFQITATTGNPDTAANIANALAGLYLADQVAAKQAAATQSFDWLSDRVYTLQDALEAKEAQINAIVVANRANDAEVLDALSRQAIEARQRLIDAQRALQEAEQKLDQFDNTPTNASLNRSGMRQQLQADIQRFATQTAILQDFQSDIDRQLSQQSESQLHLQQLRREADATRTLYQSFLARLQETNVQRSLQTADSRVLTAATAGQYVGPRKTLILMIAALIGTVIGIGVVLLRKACLRGFTSAEALADTLALPVLTQIPRLPSRKPSKLLPFLNRKPTSAAAEAIRNMRTALLMADPGEVPQVILSTSSKAGEGKTTQSIALAHNLAQLGKRVLLIEADSRRPTFHRYFGRQDHDLGAIFAGQATADPLIQHDDRLGADVLYGKASGKNPADQFADPHFAKLIDAFRQTYDIIILDAPPVLPVPDARILSQYSDAIVYAVRWGKTDKRLVLAGKRALADVNATITGLVMTQVDQKRARQFGAIPLADYGQPYYQG